MLGAELEDKWYEYRGCVLRQVNFCRRHGGAVVEGSIDKEDGYKGDGVLEEC